MENVVEEAKQETVKDDFDSKADEFFTKSGKEESSASEGNEGEEVIEDKDTGADQSKKASPEDKVSKSPVEEKLAKVAEILGDDVEAIEAYIKQHGYHKDPAWQKLLAKAKSTIGDKEVKPVVDEETKREIEQFKKTTSSPEYIRFSMKEQGYTEEAINAKLNELGHKVDTNALDFHARVLKRYNIEPSNFATQEEYQRSKDSISDIATIARDIAIEIVESRLGEKMKPIEETVTNITRKEAGAKYSNDMQRIVKTDGVLDWSKEVEPELIKFIDENPKATQEDVFNYFKDLNHELSIKKLSIKGKKNEREESKTNLRSNTPGVRIEGGKFKKTGDFDKDANAFFESRKVED